MGPFRSTRIVCHHDDGLFEFPVQAIEQRKNFFRGILVELATVIGTDGFIVSTVEHLMAAFSGLSIDNAKVEVDSYELPIMDGSAGPFVRMLKSAGVQSQSGPRHYFVIKSPIELSNDDKFVGPGRGPGGHGWLLRQGIRLP